MAVIEMLVKGTHQFPNVPPFHDCISHSAYLYMRTARSLFGAANVSTWAHIGKSRKTCPYKI
jgi:hypothetical protein